MESGRPLSGIERREHERFPVTAMRVDYSTGEHFLFAPLENISEMGIFIRAKTVFPVGTELALTFALEGGTEKLALGGVVAWVNPERPGAASSQGMGVRFAPLTDAQREAVLELIRALAYVQ
jgi:uncharacterized protein (TIGR02266 family)